MNTSLDSKNACNNNCFYMALNNKNRNNKETNQKKMRLDCKDFNLINCCGFFNKSNKPIYHNNIFLYFSGIIYNYSEIRKYVEDDSIHFEHDYKNLIIYLYLQYGIEYTLQLLEGEFILILIHDDFKNLKKPETKMYVAKDRLGKHPLYMLLKRDFINENILGNDELLENIEEFTDNRAKRIARNTEVDIDDDNEKIFGFSTTLSLLCDDLNDIPKKPNNQYYIMPFPPGTYSKYTLPYVVMSTWTLTDEFVKYNNWITPRFLYKNSRIFIGQELEFYIKSLQTKLLESVHKINIDINKPSIACLLSGGIDSNIITALICEYIKTINTRNGKNIKVDTFCIGFENSDDIRQSRNVAKYLGTNHTEVIITEKDYIQAINDVIKIIETYDIATVRAAVAQYLLCKYIKENTNHVEIITGDGVDEIMGGYLYTLAAPNIFEFDRECRSLLNNYHTNYGLLRKIYIHFDMRQITPFLNQSFIDFYFSIPVEFRFSVSLNKLLNMLMEEIDGIVRYQYVEKYLFRIAFAYKFYKNANNEPLLSIDAMHRTKEDFFDGISNYPNSTRQIISKYLSNDMTSTCNKHHQPVIEKQYYRNIFDLYFSNSNHIIIHLWKTKYTLQNEEPSAHVLDYYFDLNPEYSERSL